MKNLIRILAVLLFMSSNAMSWANHWVPNHNQFSDNMNIIGVLEINGVEQATDVFEVGVFCGDECRGSEMLTYYSGVDRHMLFMTLYGQSGDVMSFRLYDHGSQRELELTPPETIQFVSNDILGSIPDPYVISFSGGIAVITAKAIPEEGGTITGAAAYWYGETCTLQAPANEGYTFVDWTENGQQVSTEPTLSIFVMESHDLQANFSVNSYEISLEAQPDEGGTVSGMGSYDYGTMVTVTATPEPESHYLFVNWTEDDVMVSDSAEYTFMVQRDRHLVAHFAQERYAIKSEVSPENAGTVDGVGYYLYGQTATLTARPDANYEFVEWTEDGTFLSNHVSISFIVTQDRVLEAHFNYYDGVEEEGHTMSVFPNPTNGLVRIEGLQEGGEIRVMNESGNIVLVKPYEGSDAVIDLGFAPDGCYILYVVNGEEKQIKKIVKF